MKLNGKIQVMIQAMMIRLPFLLIKQQKEKPGGVEFARGMVQIILAGLRLIMLQYKIVNR